VAARHKGKACGFLPALSRLRANRTDVTVLRWPTIPPFAQNFSLLSLWTDPRCAAF